MRKVSPTLVIFWFLICGCAGGNSPIIPAAQEPEVEIPALTSQNTQEPAIKNSVHHLWLFHQVYVNPTALDYGLIPNRNVGGHWNILTWLENGPCYDCFQITGLTPSGSGTLLVDIQITHPFNNPNLTGFDVRGIAMFEGSKTFPVSGLTTSDRLQGDGELVNADGYTTLYNITTAGSGPNGMEGYQSGNFEGVMPPNAILNGYKRYISDDPANTRNAFYSGDSVTSTFEIDMPDGPFIFGYAVDSSWEKADNIPVTDPMIDFPTSANCPEPWKIEITETPVGQGLTEQGGETVLEIDVYDWQGKSSHLAPALECPELFDESVTAGWVEDGTGYSRWEVTIENTKLAGEGEYEILISVWDSENATAPEWLDLTAYQVTAVHVNVYQNQAPTAAASADPNPQVVCEDVHFFNDGSEDPDGTITKYEWDWDNDGVFDEEGSDAYYSWDTPGTYFVQFQVTDDEDATDDLDEPLEIVIENADPTADIAGPSFGYFDLEYQFDATGSYDGDCAGVSISMYEWDWDDGNGYNEGESIETHSWSVEGNYLVKLRVTDDEDDGIDETQHEVQISIDLFDPVAVASAVPNPQTICLNISFDAGESDDPDGGDITLYEWDWDNDGVYDEMGDLATHSWDVPGTYYVQLRVTDDEGATDTLDTPIEVFVDNALPTASAVADQYDVGIGENINLDGSSSVDNDCGGESIETWEWDFDFDGTFDSDGVGDVVVHSYNSAGSYQIQLRVTDDEVGPDMLDVPLEITVDPCDPDTDDPPVTDVDCPPYNQNQGTTEVPIIVNDSYDPYDCTPVVELKYSWRIKLESGSWGGWSNWGYPEWVNPDLMVYVTGLGPGIWDIEIKSQDNILQEGNTEECSINIPDPTCNETEPNNLTANADPITFDCESVGSVCGGDSTDFWKFSLTTTTTVNFYLTFIETISGDFSMALIGPNGPILEYSHFNASSPIDDTWLDLEAGTYKISLIKTPGSCFDYTFTVSI